ncbi:MAG: hypothetical protein RLZZ450_3591 [Pseudomonadota bacterium]
MLDMTIEHCHTGFEAASVPKTVMQRCLPWKVQRRLFAAQVGLGALLLFLFVTNTAFAHGVAAGDAELVSHGAGVRAATFLWLGAKHMVTGYDHLLFLAGVVFYLRSLRQVAAYVTLFAVGHSLTLVSFVLLSVRVDPSVVDAVIALSVVYKAVENLGGLPRWVRIDPRAAVFAFGLVHGVGLASKLQTLRLARDGLLANLVAFNVGVELGQLVALSALVLALLLWRRRADFVSEAALGNRVLVALGFVLFGAQLSSYLTEPAVLAASNTVATSPTFAHPFRRDVIDIPLGLGAELEYKLAMAAGDVVVYSWSVVGEGKVYFEFHGESTDAPVPHVESYRTEDGAHASHGSLAATFAGIHGWYLLNDSEAPIVVRLAVAGYYELAPQFAQVGAVRVDLSR